MRRWERRGGRRWAAEYVGSQYMGSQYMGSQYMGCYLGWGIGRRWVGFRVAHCIGGAVGFLYPTKGKQVSVSWAAGSLLRYRLSIFPCSKKKRPVRLTFSRSSPIGCETPALCDCAWSRRRETRNRPKPFTAYKAERRREIE